MRRRTRVMIRGQIRLYPSAPKPDTTQNEQLIAQYVASGGTIKKVPMRGPRCNANWRENANRAAQGRKPNATNELKPNWEAWRYRLLGIKRHD